MTKISQFEKLEKEAEKKIEEQNSEITTVNKNLNCALKKISHFEKSEKESEKKISMFEKSDKDALKKLKEQNSKISKLEKSEKDAENKIKEQNSELTLVKNELEKVNCVKENTKGEKISKLRNAKAAARSLELRSQSFTSLMADQDINRVSSFSRCLNGTFP